MSNPPKKRMNKVYILIIPVIAFIIGYYSMMLIQTFKWDAQLFQIKAQNQLNFQETVDKTPLKTGILSDSSPEERQSEQVMKSIVFPSMEIYCIETGTYVSDVKAFEKCSALSDEGYAAIIYKERVLHVLLTASKDRSSGEALMETYGLRKEKLSLYKVHVEPAVLMYTSEAGIEDLTKTVDYTIALLTQTFAYMDLESIKAHTQKEKKAFLKSQRDGILLARQGLERSKINAQLNEVRENVFQLLNAHEHYLSLWEKAKKPSQRLIWQGLLEGLFQYERIVR